MLNDLICKYGQIYVSLFETFGVLLVNKHFKLTEETYKRHSVTLCTCIDLSSEVLSSSMY